MSELPTLDFWLDYPDGQSVVLENAPGPTPKEMNVERQAPQPPLDSPINLSDVRPLSPTQQPMRTAEYRVKPASLGQNEVNRPRTSSFPDKQTPPMTRESKGVVVAAAEIVQQLEEMMCAGLSAIDEVLRVNKEATRKITDLISRTDYDSSFGSSIVVVAAAHHVVCLFENACGVLYPSCSSGNQQSMSSRKTQDNSIAFGYSRRRLLGGTVGCGNELLPTPGIGFGSFRMDPQEQAALCAQIISTELHRSLRMVQSLSMPLQTGCFGLDPAGVAVDGWLQDLKQRLRSLISAVERSEQLWPR